MDGSYVIPFDGEWDFFYDPKKFICGKSVLPNPESFTGRMVTPGYWDDHYELFAEEDFFSRPARFNPDYRKPYFPMGTTLLPHASSSFLIGTGYYRKQIELDLTGGKRAVLTVGPAMWGCSVYCNRQPAGSVTGYSTSSDFDLTPFIRSGTRNEIILVVCNVHDDGGAFCRVDGSHDGIPYGARPGQHRGLAAQGYQSERAGIGGPVFIKVTGPAAIADFYVSFEDGYPHWHAELINGTGKILRWSLSDEGTIIDSNGMICAADTLDFYTGKCPPELWSDRKAKLYTVRLEVMDGDNLSDAVECLWGARTLKCIGNRIAINGEVTYFRGVTEHCYFAGTCNPHWDETKYLHDLGQLKKAGFNFIRCHTWCPPEPFYQACDRLGFYVQTELPSVWSFAEAEAIIRLIRKHPSAVIFCEGNEKLINDEVLARMKKLVEMFRRLAPGMLFNPQEAMRYVEYDFGKDRKIEQDPVPHDAARLADVAEFSDVYGSLGFGYFSYFHDEFPGPEQTDREHSHYKKPCLSHEIGILGGYLDFDLEKKYEGTYIGTDLFQAARACMIRKNVYQNWRRYYENNCRFISAIRKQLMENIRSCSSITGFDFLGGIDTHWHLTGYPCGILDEFYNEKFGETIADVRRYNSESQLLCSALRFRNRFSGTRFAEKIRLSYFGSGTGRGKGNWTFTESDGQTVLAQGDFSFDQLQPGNIYDLAEVSFVLPDRKRPGQYILQVRIDLNGQELENNWKFFVFPKKKTDAAEGCRIADELSSELIDFVEHGGKLLLTGHFPSETRTETYRPHTSGRTLGHSGGMVNPHPVWCDFPQEGFSDWQFYPLMSGSTSIIYDREMPEFQPAFELIPSFKLIRRKSLLSEFQVGKGRIIMCGFVLNQDEPAGSWLKHALMDYLKGGDYVPAPEWPADDLRKRLAAGPQTGRREIAVDAGGRPVE